MSDQIIQAPIMRRITYREAVSFLIVRHYSGRTPPVSYAYGVFENDVLVAVCTFGKPPSHHLCIGVCGINHKASVFELNRLCTDGMTTVCLSQFVGWCLRQLKEFNLIIVSYADSQMNHHGFIYQATNFIYTGATRARTEQYIAGGKHSRHSKPENQDGELRKFRSSKHRYVYFAADRRNKKIFEADLMYKVEPYPKGDNKDYVLGEFMKPLILKNGEPYIDESMSHLDSKGARNGT